MKLSHGNNGATLEETEAEAIAFFAKVLLIVCANMSQHPCSGGFQGPPQAT